MPATTQNHSELVPIQKSDEILVNVYGQSAVLQQANVRQMAANVEEITQADFPDAMWPAGMADIGELEVKPLVGDADFAAAQLIAGKIAAQKVVSDELKDDSIIDIISFYQTAIEQRFAYLIDLHALNGGAWAGTNGLINAVTAAGPEHRVAESADPTADSSAMLAAVENKGFPASGFVFDIRKKADFRDQVDGSNRPIFYGSTAEGAPSTLWGEPVNFLGGGVFRVAPNAIRGVVGDWSNFVIGIRQQITAETSNTAIVGIPGQAGYVNAWEQNATILRVEMRLGALVLNAEAFAILQQGA